MKKNSLNRKKNSMLVLCCFCVQLVAYTQTSKKALFVIVDGIAADVIETQPTPFLDQIAAEGGYARAHVGGEKDGYSQTPTISAVGYNSLLTGTWVNKHNVWDNDIKAPNYNYWTIFRFFKEQYPEKKTAVFSSWEDNRTKLVGESLPATGHIKLAYHFDGLELDTVNFPHDRKKAFMQKIDDVVVDTAAAYIKRESPDLSWVYLQYTDDMGHMYGDSPEFFNAVSLMDKQMGRLWDAITYRKKQFDEDWVIYITTDHGRDKATGKGHGGQSERERSTWIVSNAKQLNEYFKKGIPGVVDIMPSMARLLKLSIPRSQLMEVDGVSITGKISAVKPQANWQDGKVKINWKAMQKKGKAKIWITTTNHFKEGGKDKYELIKVVPLKKQEAIIDVSNMPSNFYKIVIETPHNFLNRWIFIK